MLLDVTNHDALQGRGGHHLLDDTAAGTSGDPNSDLMFMSMAPFPMPVRSHAVQQHYFLIVLGGLSPTRCQTCPTLYR